MPRRKRSPAAAAQPTAAPTGTQEPRPLPPQAHVIDPRAVYTLEAARHALGLPKSCLGREVRLCRLRVSRRAGRYYVLGQWILEWLEAGAKELDQRKADRKKARDGDVSAA